jgi:hypothetical protein
LIIKSSAQTGSVFLCKIETERTRTRAPAPEVIASRARRIDGGILNLDSALIATLREAKLGETRAKDYLKALGSLRGWGDGDPFLVNYVGHPMMGSVTGFIQVQNTGRGRRMGGRRRYDRSLSDPAS